VRKAPCCRGATASWSAPPYRRPLTRRRAQTRAPRDRTASSPGEGASRVTIGTLKRRASSRAAAATHCGPSRAASTVTSVGLVALPASLLRVACSEQASAWRTGERFSAARLGPRCGSTARPQLGLGRALVSDCAARVSSPCGRRGCSWVLLPQPVRKVWVQAPRVEERLSRSAADPAEAAPTAARWETVRPVLPSEVAPAEREAAAPEP
jgi:hypothetical protein